MSLLNLLKNILIFNLYGTCMRKILYILLVMIGCTVNTAFAEENLETLIKSGNNKFNNMKYEEAMEIYEKGLKTNPEEPILFYNKGNVLFQQEKYEEALNVFKDAIKNNPKKILLKNIWFNAGNVHYKIAEKKSAESESIENLKAVLAEYENAFDMYRKSLELDRKISIAQGWDIHKAGVYAKQNWALARAGWTDIWEKIRELEKKNLKLEDGIMDLLKAQKILLPQLEKVYLNSASKDVLKINLKVLAEFQIDLKEDIHLLQKLAEKDVERTITEIENYKVEKKNAQAAGHSGQLSDTQVDPELTKLEDAQKNSEEIQKVVDTASGFEEWISDGLKRGEPLVAWKNSRLMISLLQSLNDFLKKEDPCINIYLNTLTDLAESDSLVARAYQMELPETQDEKKNYEELKLRMLNLSSKKFEASAEDFAKINEYLKLIKEKVGTEKKTSQTDPVQDQPGVDAEKQEQSKNPFVSFIEKAFLEVTKASIDDVSSRNNAILKKMKDISSLLSETREKKSIDIDRTSKDCGTAMTRYIAIHRSVTELLSALIKESEAMQDQLLEITGDNFDEMKIFFVETLASTDVLMFKYKVLLDELKKSEAVELNPLKETMPKYYFSLNKVWSDFSKLRSNELKKIDDTNALNDKTASMRAEYLKSLVILSPDTAVAHYYDRIKTLHSKVMEQLPATRKNRRAIVEKYAPVERQIMELTPLLEQYFSMAGKSVDALTDEEKKNLLSNKLIHRKKSIDHLKIGLKEVKDAIAFFKKEHFLKGELLTKDLNTSLEKSYLAFTDKPEKAQQALELGIKWQNVLKEQTRAGVEIETGEGNSRAIAANLTKNQSDIMNMAGLANMKIREMMEEAEKAKTTQGQGQQSMPGMPQGQTCPNKQVDPKKMDEAIKYVQDALIEATKIHSFLEANEFQNTNGKHDQVVELFEKALEALKSKDDQSCDNKDQDKKQPDKDQQQKDQKNQKQGGQSGQQKPKPLELTPEQAQDLLNQLNKQDKKRMQNPAKGKRSMNTPRPW